MQANNPILARFQNAPALVAESSQAWFESCVVATAEALPGLREMADSSGNFWPAADNTSGLDRVRPYNVVDGVLQIAVQGVLLNNFPYSYEGWATGYEYIWQAMLRGMSDPAVNGIALLVDSPGGMAAGLLDLADRMYAMRGQKPIQAFAAEKAYSAAYAIASTADSITVTRSGGVGSIGVVVMHVDVSEQMAQDGLKINFIFAGKHKVDGNSYQPLPDAVRARIQLEVDASYNDFVALVARNRSMSEADVQATEAQCFMAQEALDNGLADFIGPKDDAILAFVASLSNGDETMANKPAEDDPKTHAELDSAVAAAAQTAKAEGVTEGTAAAMTRINAIMDSDAGKAHPKAALQAALKTSMPAAEAIAFLAELPEEKAEEPTVAAEEPGAGAPKGLLEAAMAGTKNPNLSADDAAAEDPDAAWEANMHDHMKAFGIGGSKQEIRQ